MTDIDYPNDVACERCVIAIAEIKRLRADNARLEALRKSMRDELLRGRAYDERAEAIRDELVAALGGLILHVEELDHYGECYGEADEMKIARKAYQAGGGKR